ncbi:MAG: InlB B-repeat-containing protein [Clostridia bacterium]|nr:InlB B-repeat-containing protein [Clostridia bacterium]
MKKWQKALVGLLVGVGMTFAAAGCDDGLTVTFMDGDKKVEMFTDLEKDKPIKLPDAPKKDGYTFVGWYTDAALTKPYEQDSTVTKNMTLYAKYTRSQLYVVMDYNYSGAPERGNVAVTYGEAYELPTPEREGYTFTGWTLNGNSFDASGDSYPYENGVTVWAQWALNKYTVTYSDGENSLGTKTVEHGQTVDAWTEVDAGYQIDGIFTDKEFTKAYDQTAAVTGNLTLYVKKSPKTYTITINQAYTDDNTFTAQYQGTYALPTTLERAGYTFKGYTYNGNAFEATGTYSDTQDITVVAIWEAIPGYNNRSVSFYYGEKEYSKLTITVEKGNTITLPEGPIEVGYTFAGWYADEALTTPFDEATVIQDDISVYAKFTAKTYTLTYEHNDETETVTYGGGITLDKPAKEGYKFIKYKAEYNGAYIYFENLIIENYTWDSNLILTAVWEEIPEDEEESTSNTFIEKELDANNGIGYYKERATVNDQFTFVFLKGTTYDLREFTNLAFIGADGFVTGVDGVKFKASAVGEFQITFTRTTEEGDTVVFTRNAKIVNEVNVLEQNADYLGSWGTNANRTAFINAKAEAVLSVGASNFQPGLNIGYVDNVADEHYDYASGNIVVTVKVGNAESKDYTVENGTIYFGASLVGETVTLTFETKYPSFYAKTNPVSMTVQVNDGVNVYTSAELRAAYGNVANKTINILRNITAELPEEDYADLAKGAPLNAYEFGAYRRITHDKTDSVAINGNFFQINASNIPLVDNRYDNRGKWAVEGTAGYYVNEVQVGVFLYWNTLANSGNRTDYHSGQLTINDLSISGNNVGAADLRPEKIGETPILKNSGSWNGIVCRGGTVNVNNTTIMNTNCAIFADGGVSSSDSTQQSVQYNLHQVKTENSWNTSVYLFYLCKLNVTESYFGQGSAGSIMVDDRAYNKDTETTLNTVVNVDQATTFNNWVAGTEAWFVAYGQAETAVQLKVLIEKGIDGQSGVAGASGGTCTVLDTTGEKINLVLLVRSVNSEVSDWQTDDEGKPFVEHNLTKFGSSQTAIPGLGSQVFQEFDNTIKTTDPTLYMYGLVEVRSK